MEFLSFTVEVWIFKATPLSECLRPIYGMLYQKTVSVSFGMEKSYKKGSVFQISKIRWKYTEVFCIIYSKR